MEDVIHTTKYTHAESFCVMNPCTGSGARSTPLSAHRIHEKANDLAERNNRKSFYQILDIFTKTNRPNTKAIKKQFITHTQPFPK
jgi:hypothetical protein